ncbi:MAG: HAMP domain-containing sensor histidine kinase [Archangium sp.]
MNRARAWLTSNYDVILFAAALASVGPLMVWWSILVRRNILHTDQLLRSQIETAFDGEQRLERIAALDLTTNRQLFMIGGESALAGFLIVVLAVALFAVARHRRRETQRLQSMLQLTTHQLKTPLAGVRALLQSLGNGSIPADAHAKFITQGVAECDRLEHLVETTLAYQRTVARQGGKLEPVSTRTLVSEILEHRRASFPDDEVKWTPRDGTQVICDRDAVRVVLENLLDNARKYGGGKVEVAEDARNAKWRLEIRDRGQGFEARDAERLFEPFERGGAHHGVAHGSGLGLYISRQLARRMRGELTATSDGPGKGATFALELEVARG